jgi:hypothetical protein
MATPWLARFIRNAVGPGPPPAAARLVFLLIGTPKPEAMAVLRIEAVFAVCASLEKMAKSPATPGELTLPPRRAGI